MLTFVDPDDFEQHTAELASVTNVSKYSSRRKKTLDRVTKSLIAFMQYLESHSVLKSQIDGEYIGYKFEPNLMDHLWFRRILKKFSGHDPDNIHYMFFEYSADRETGIVTGRIWKETSSDVSGAYLFQLPSGCWHDAEPTEIMSLHNALLELRQELYDYRDFAL